jgi:MurNAc alpha-1-phosphate uridylyltransferase
MQAMILAAGRGERMRPLSDRVPKPLLVAGGRPLIVHLIERLAAGGVRDLVINRAHLGAQLEAALGDGRALGVSIRWSRERVALETAGGIAHALPLLAPGPFLVVNGDIWCDVDYRAFARAPLPPERLAHLLLVDNPPHHPDGDFALAGDLARIDAAPRYTYAGIGLYQPALFAGIVPGTKAKLAPLLACAIERGAIGAERHRGRWFDIGTPQRLAALDAMLRAAR